MASYWFMDGRQRVLGPVGKEVLADLVALGRLSQDTPISTDGWSFAALSTYAELQAAAVAPPPSPDQVRATEVRAELQRIQALPVHAQFGVASGGDPREYRQAFLELARQYHPGRLPKTAHADLVRACMEMFQHLSGQLVLVEREAQPQADAPAPAPAPARPAPIPPAHGATLRQGPESSATRTRDELSRLVRRPDGRLEAMVSVTYANCGIFTDHRLVNLATGGVFLPTPQRLPLGSRLDLRLQFDPPPHELRTFAAVVLEAQRSERVTQSGVGIRLDKLGDGDRRYIEGFLLRAKTTAAKVRSAG